jgi:steroid delta-isomerase-like uncharacterized protein
MTATTRNSPVAVANADLSRSIYDAFNRGDFEHAVSLCSPDISIDFVAWEHQSGGHDAVRAFLTNWKTMAPDGVVEVLAQLSGDEGVASENVFRGTNTGTLISPEGEVAPTGRAFAVRFCEVLRIADGQIVSITNYADIATLLVQLGLMPEPSNATA